MTFIIYLMSQCLHEREKLCGAELENLYLRGRAVLDPYIRPIIV